MDITTIAATLSSASAQSLSSSVATTLLKNDFNSQKDILQLLTPSANGASTLGALGPGVGGNLDVSV
jgi:hypothetical protein